MIAGQSSRWALMLVFAALMISAFALGGCATVPVAQAQAKAKHHKFHKRSTAAYAKVKGPAARRFPRPAQQPGDG
jgi:hypothetical protein